MQYFKRNLRVILFYTFILSYHISFSQLQVITCNIRYDNPDDGENTWELRKSDLVDLLKYYQPDIFGLQEALPHQANYIGTSLNNYRFIMVGRDGPDNVSEATPIFYNPEKLELLETQTFWLSETPDKVSKGWDAALNRIFTFARFREKENNKELVVINTHFDHIGEEARKNSALTIVKKATEMGWLGGRILLMGDFNCEPDKEPYSILKRTFSDSRDIATKAYGPIGTWNGFEVNSIIDRRIDYIFTKNLEIEVQRHIDDRRPNNLQVSDHLAILVELH